MGEKSSINHIMAHEKIRNLVFEEWEKTNLLLNQGPDVIKQYFCKLWDEVKLEVEYDDDIDVIDLDRKIEPNDFGVSYSVLGNGITIFNFLMPKPLTSYGQVLCLSLVITKRIPRLFTLELLDSKEKDNFYSIGEWQIDFQNNDYIHKSYGDIDEPSIGKFVGKISSLLNL